MSVEGSAEFVSLSGQGAPDAEGQVRQSVENQEIPATLAEEVNSVAQQEEIKSPPEEQPLQENPIENAQEEINEAEQPAAVIQPPVVESELPPRAQTSAEVLPTEMPGQQHETQIVSETPPLTLPSDAVEGPNQARVLSGMDLPLNQLNEENESAIQATQSNEDLEPINQDARGGEILVENGSHEGSREGQRESINGEQMTMEDKQHTMAEQQLIEVEKLQDEAKFQEVFRKTFITEQKKGAESEELWTMADMQIPQGQPAKLIRVFDAEHADFRVSEVCDRLKFVEPTPVVLMAGAAMPRQNKTMTGVARAACNSGSVLIDSGLNSGIETFTMRKGTNLIGVCPDAQVSFPKISSKQPNQLSNGHTHFFLVGPEDRESATLAWGSESKLKYELAQRIVKGRVSSMGGSIAPPCKLVTVVIGENQTQAIRDIEASLNAKAPVVIVMGSILTDNICSQLAQSAQSPQSNSQSASEPATWGASDSDVIARLVSSGRAIPVSESSEEVASIVRLLLTISM